MHGLSVVRNTVWLGVYLEARVAMTGFEPTSHTVVGRIDYSLNYAWATGSICAFCLFGIGSHILPAVNAQPTGSNEHKHGDIHYNTVN